MGDNRYCNRQYPPPPLTPPLSAHIYREIKVVCGDLALVGDTWCGGTCTRWLDCESWSYHTHGCSARARGALAPRARQAHEDADRDARAGTYNDPGHNNTTQEARAPNAAACHYRLRERFTAGCVAAPPTRVKKTCRGRYKRGPPHSPPPNFSRSIVPSARPPSPPSSRRAPCRAQRRSFKSRASCTMTITSRTKMDASTRPPPERCTLFPLVSRLHAPPPSPIPAPCD